MAKAAIDFFDKTLTSANQSSVVECCFPEKGETIKRICGRGISCAGQCSALEAELCPSGVCTEDPRDWKVEMTDGEFPPSTLSSSDLSFCAPGCRVRYHPLCCYNPICFAQREESCKWLNFLSGNDQ